jgi:hypothetical protein
MSPRKAKPDAMRWKLELPGTSAAHCRDLEAAVADVGWTKLDTRTEHKLGVTRVYIVTDRGESPEHILTELADRMQYRLPSVHRLEPTTWKAVRQRLQATKDARAAYAGRRVVVPSG